MAMHRNGRPKMLTIALACAIKIAKVDDVDQEMFFLTLLCDFALLLGICAIVAGYLGVL